MILIRTPTRFALIDSEGKPRLETPERWDVLLDAQRQVEGGYPSALIARLSDADLDELFRPWAGPAPQPREETSHDA